MADTIETRWPRTNLGQSWADFQIHTNTDIKSSSSYASNNLRLYELLISLIQTFDCVISLSWPNPFRQS